MVKLLFILSIVFYILHKYLLRRQTLQECVFIAQQILDKIQAEGGSKYAYNTPYFQYLTKINYDTRQFLKNAGKNDLLNQIEYSLKYLCSCPRCNKVTNVEKSERNHHYTSDSYLSNGRYTKDGDLDQRYNTEFKTVYTYYFDADCEHCKKSFTIELSANDHDTRNKLLN